MSFKWSVKHLDRGWDAIRRGFKDAKAEGSFVKVGVLDDGKAQLVEHGNALTNAQLAAIHEFGTRTIPARSFIRSTIAGKRLEYVRLLAKLVPGIYTQKRTIEEVLGIVGAQAASDIKDAVTTGAGIPPPLAPSTLRAKLAKTPRGGYRNNPRDMPRPLVDTGRLIGSITWQVVRVQK